MTTRTVLLGDVCEFVRGITFPSGEGKPLPFANSVACLTTSGVQQDVAWNSRRFVQCTRVGSAKQMLQVGDILISTANSKELVGKSCLVQQLPFPCTFGAFVTVARPQEGLYAPFLAYWMTTRRYLAWCLKQSSNTTNISNLRVSDLEELEIPLLDSSEQRRIAERLQLADRLRRTRRYALELTDTLLPAAFLEFFRDDSFPRAALEELAVDERNSFVNGPFGSDLLTSELTDSGVPVVYIRDISSGRYERNSSVFVTQAKAAKLEFCNVKPGDVLVTKVGDPPGIAAIYPAETAKGIVTQDVIRIRPNTELVSAFYLQGFLNSPLAHREMTKIMVQGTRLRFSLGQFKEISVPLPPLSLQQKFAALVGRVERLRLVQLQALRQAEHLFASLLHRAFSG